MDNLTLAILNLTDQELRAVLLGLTHDHARDVEAGIEAVTSRTRPTPPL